MRRAARAMYTALAIVFFILGVGLLLLGCPQEISHAELAGYHVLSTIACFWVSAVATRRLFS